MAAARRSPRAWRRWAILAVLALAAIALAVAATIAFHPAFGGKPDALHRATLSRSPQWGGAQFVNRQAIWQDASGGLARQFESVADAAPPPGYRPPRPTAGPASSPLAIRWFGHSSLSVEVGGATILIDPVWSERVSPFDWIGPRRYFPPGEIPRAADVDLVLISHDHYDHLDRGTVERLAAGGALVVVPLGVGAHLRRWGIADDRIRELDWWQVYRHPGATITATPARHGAGRVSPFANQTLWSGFAIEAGGRKLWYSGDTGFHEDLAEIGRRLGPFDVSMIDTGQYDRHWPDWHLGPEQAVAAHEAVRGKHLLPVHWAGFTLAHHGWTEPAERIVAAARCRKIPLLLPLPGERLQWPFTATAETWWPEARWRSAADDPIRSTRSGDASDRYPPLACS